MRGGTLGLSVRSNQAGACRCKRATGCKLSCSTGRCLKHLCVVCAPGEAKLEVDLHCGIVWLLAKLEIYLQLVCWRPLEVSRIVRLRQQRRKLSFVTSLCTPARSQALDTAQHEQCTAFLLPYLQAELAVFSCSSTLRHKSQCLVCVSKSQQAHWSEVTVALKPLAQAISQLACTVSPFEQSNSCAGSCSAAHACYVTTETERESAFVVSKILSRPRAHHRGQINAGFNTRRPAGATSQQKHAALPLIPSRICRFYALPLQPLSLRH